jgi:hypothetical protein
VAWSGCYSRDCGPHQKLDSKADHAVCVCEEGWTVDTKTNQCVCEEGSALDKKTGECEPVEVMDAGASPEDAGDEADSSVKPDGCGGTGLGCECKSDADCKGYDADYCVLDDPTVEGEFRVCIYDCKTPGSDECPEGSKCCQFINLSGAICLPEEETCPFG